MFTTNVIFHHGVIKIFENINKLQWASKTAVLIQTDLLIFDSNFTEEKEAGKLNTLGMQIYISRPESEWQVDLIKSNHKKSFRVANAEEAEKWHKMLVLSSSWSNYQHFCEFQKLTPWVYLLRWCARGRTDLTVNLKKCNSFALSEFLRGNVFVEEIHLEEVNNEVGLVSRIMGCFTDYQLQALSLKRAGLDDKSLNELRKCLGCNHFLKKIDLSGNHFSVLGIKTLLKIFIKMPFIESLNLSENKFAEEGLIALVPDVFQCLPLKTLKLCNIGIGDESVYHILRIMKIKGLELELLDISSNDFSIEIVKLLLKKLLRYKKKREFIIRIAPYSIEEDVVKYFKVEDVILKRSAAAKSIPKMVQHRETIDDLSKKIDRLLENPFIEDLVELIKEFSSLDFQFPRVRLDPIEKLANDYLIIAISQPNYYCLELLLPCLKKIGIFHSQAEEIYNLYRLEADHIINTLENILSPDLYTEENIPKINTLLDSVLRRCDELCIRGEIVQVARILKNKRDDFVKKIKTQKNFS